MTDENNENDGTEETEEEQYLDEEQEIWAQNLLDDLTSVRDATEVVIPKVEELLEDELTVSEYEDFVEENEETFKDVQL